MIAPGLQVVDVEPDGFGVVNALLSRHDRRDAGELHVLHDGGRVLRVVHTVHGPTAASRAQVGDDLGDDLAERAVKLRTLTGVDRVVLVDREGFRSMSHDLAACGPQDVDQPTAFRRSHRVFWSSPAVVTDPAPPSDASWLALEQHLRALGSDYRALLAGYDGDRCAFTLVGRFVDGRLAHLTSLQAVLGDVRPVAAAAAQLLVAAETLGEVPLALIAPLDVLRGVAVAPDLPAALSSCTPQALLARGVPS